MLGREDSGVAHFVTARATIEGWVHLACGSLARGAVSAENPLSVRCPGCLAAASPGRPSAAQVGVEGLGEGDRLLDVW